MSRRHRLPAAGWRATASSVAAWSVLFAAVQIGMQTPAREVRATPAAGTGLDYTAMPGTVAPLTDTFIAEALGLPPPELVQEQAPTPVRPPTSTATTATTATFSGPAAPSQGGRVEVTHPPTNDTFAQAYEIPSIPFTARTDARSASRQADEPRSCSPVGSTLWYRYSPGRTTGLVASTVGTPGATSLAVFTGSGIDDLRQIGCDADLGGDAHVAFEALADSVYFFQVTRPGGGPTVFTLDPAGITERISLNRAGEEVDGARYWMGATSVDGRFVAFQSLSSQLVPGDTNAAWDIFVKDRLTGHIDRVSVASDGTEGNGHSWSLSIDISANGRYVAFYSWSDNLVPDDTNDEQDSFVHDRLTGETRRISVSSSGRQGERFAAAHVLLTPMRADCELRPRDAPAGGHQHLPCTEWAPDVSMTPDGSTVLFESALLGLIDGEHQEPSLVDAHEFPPYHVYAHDLRTGETTRVSVNAAGEPGNDASSAPSVSADGRFVAFQSMASNLVPGVDPGDTFQIFLADRATGDLRLVSEGVDGRPANARNFTPKISDDGRVVAFASVASNLVHGDRNEFTDVFAYDVASSSFELVSVDDDGRQQQFDRDAIQRANFGEIYALVSADGRYVAFDSPADNLSARDEPRTGRPTSTDCFDDVFLRDRDAGTTLLVSVNSQGAQANNCSWVAGLSLSGTEVVFVSPADNLVEDDTNGSTGGGTDLFLHSIEVLR